MAEKTSDIQIGLDEKARTTSIEILNTLLADEVLLYIKTRNFHWNVEGPSFSEHHKFFESQYEALDEILDEVAERARSLDGRAVGSMNEYLKLTRLKEARAEIHASRDTLQLLLNDHQTLVRQIREDIDAVGKAGDVGTEDFLTGVMESHEKMAWMLRSYLR